MARAAWRTQGGADVRFDWGLAGLRTTTGTAETDPDADTTVVVVVDVLSFSSAVDVAVGRGAAVWPAEWHGGRADELARQFGALLAVGRRHVTPARPYSLSPGSLASLPPGSRLVLPSPNGATVCAAARGHAATVLVGCLRNATAVARVLSARAGAVTVVAAGERWPDGTLRPAFEDLVGAGAIIDRLRALDPARSWSPEARSAEAAFRNADLETDLRTCVSGLELADGGFAHDVDAASALDVSSAVPELAPDGWIVDRAAHPRSVTDAEPA
jgi:2-phosphosulfolactate phosphatase